MADPMTHRQIAKVLGISRSMVVIIEQRAIAKLALAIGVERKLPAWILREFHGRLRQNVCGRCGGIGHNKRGCTE